MTISAEGSDDRSLEATALSWLRLVVLNRGFHLRLICRKPCQRKISCLALVSLVVLGIAFLMLFTSSELSMASDDLTSVEAELRGLGSATEITLLIVPYPTLFRVSVDKIQLPNVSCVYQITSGRGPTFGEVFDVIRRADIQYVDGPRGADLRVGIILRKPGKVLWELYFDDGGGKQEVKGFSGDRRIVASADLPSQLRALLARPDVVLLKTGNNSNCPRS
jgi:hypothetical protein